MTFESVALSLDAQKKDNENKPVSAAQKYRDLLDAAEARAAEEEARIQAEELEKEQLNLNDNQAEETQFIPPAQPENPQSVEPQIDNAADVEEAEEEDTQAARKGRPRSEKSRKAILKAVNTLLLNTTVQDLSIEAIAKKAKVGKTTIYRWWPNKTAVVMDALINQPGMQTPLPTASSHAEAIEMQLDKLVRLLSSNNGQIIAQLFSEAQADERSLQIFNDNFLGPLMDAVQYSLECGKRDAEFQADLDIQMAIDMLCGPIFFRLMAHPQDLNTKFQYAYPPRAIEMLKA